MNDLPPFPLPPRGDPQPMTEEEIARAHSWQEKREAWKKRYPRGLRKITHKKEHPEGCRDSSKDEVV